MLNREKKINVKGRSHLYCVVLCHMVPRKTPQGHTFTPTELDEQATYRTKGGERFEKSVFYNNYFLY